jgi:DNA polymerase-4
LNADRTIFHVDMDAFFASIEQLDNPALRGKPVLVGYDGPRGVVAAASYEARQFNCHSAQPMSLAKRRCPQAIIVPVRFSRYREVSGKMFAIFDE